MVNYSWDCAGEANRRSMRYQGYIAAVGRSSADQRATLSFELIYLGRHALLFDSEFFLEGLYEGLLLVVPGGHVDELDILLEEFSRSIIHMTLMDSTEHLDRGELDPSGHGSGLGTVDDPFVHVFDQLICVPDVVPDANFVGYDVGRLAAFEDDIVEAMG